MFRSHVAGHLLDSKSQRRLPTAGHQVQHVSVHRNKYSGLGARRQTPATTASDRYSAGLQAGWHACGEGPQEGPFPAPWEERVIT